MSLTRDEIGIVIKNVENRRELLSLLEALPDKFKPQICEKLFKMEFPYTRLDDIPKKYNTDYQTARNYMLKIMSEKISCREYEECILNRRPDKCMMIPINLHPIQGTIFFLKNIITDIFLDVFKKFWIEFKEEYFEYLDAIDDMYRSKKRMRDDIKTDSDRDVKNFMTSLMLGLKLNNRRTKQIIYELPLQRKYLFSQLLVEHELIYLIPRVADCIVDLKELGYREHGKYWCLQKDNDNFVICGCDTDSYSDYGTIPAEFSFPNYSPEYFWDIVSYNQVLKIDTNHPEIREQLTQQRNNRHIILKTTSPVNYLIAGSDNEERNKEVDYFAYVSWINNELHFY